MKSLNITCCHASDVHLLNPFSVPGTLLCPRDVQRREKQAHCLSEDSES